MVDNENKKDENTELACYSHDEDGYNSGSDCETYAGEEEIECKVYDYKHIHDEKTVDYFIDENIWDKIGKELKDYDENDMDMLKWKSIEDCIEFYKTYAKVKGFGVRMGQLVKSRKDEHNHEMVKPTQVPYMRSFRKINELDEIKIKSMHNSGIAPNRMMRNFVNEAGSSKNVGFISKDLYNFLDRIKREEVKDGDAETVMAYLYGKKESDPFFSDGYKPLTIITDRDKAMANAISQVLPEAKHRLCLWHIMRNLKSNGNKSFHDGFMRCADKCRKPMDFEQAWKELVDKHEVEGKVWVQDLYGVKEKWAEAYMRGYFYAGMRTTQRCESMNKTLKALLDRKVMLYQFVECYHKELQSLRWKESHEDYKTMDEQPYCDGVLATLKSNAAKVYTRNAFSTLCKEMSYEGFYLVKERELKNDCMCYWLENVEKEKSYLVLKNIIQDSMHCCCMKLESVGFPCRHLFAVLKYEKAKEIPRGCIMKRWTIYAKEDGLQKKDECVESDNPTTVQARYSNLASYCVNICHRASQTLKTFNEVKDQFAKMSLKLQADKVGSKKRNSKNKEFLGIGDPIVVETGRGKPKKIKRQASSFNPTHVPYVEDDEDVTLDLHKTFESASNKHCDRGYEAYRCTSNIKLSWMHA
ncbi:hypothetical protein GQ457_10G011920 [Hibiscus cannabinus]